MSDRLEQMRAAQEAIERGEKQVARSVLRDLLSQNVDDAEAWLLCARVSDHKEQAIYCLEQVLRLNPRHASAQKWLRLLENEWSASQSVASESLAEEPSQPQSSKGHPLAPTAQTATDTGEIALRPAQPLPLKRSYCPHLGLRDDPPTRYGYSHPLNYCYRLSKPQPIELSWQRQYCLRENYSTCRVFQSQSSAEGDRNLFRRWIKRRSHP
jgi:hypothetical protein